jgi:hypothetical protein
MQDVTAAVNIVFSISPVDYCHQLLLYIVGSRVWIAISSHTGVALTLMTEKIFFVYYGPLQPNGIYLLDLPFHSHLKPIALSTSFEIAFPHVAVVPGPTSLPGGLIV